MSSIFLFCWFFFFLKSTIVNGFGNAALCKHSPIHKYRPLFYSECKLGMTQNSRHFSTLPNNMYPRSLTVNIIDHILFTSELAIRNAKVGNVERSTYARATGLLKRKKILVHFNDKKYKLCMFMHCMCSM